MPELALGFFVGGILSALFLLFTVYQLQQKFNSQAYRQLQANLKKLQLIWSENNGDLVALSAKGVTKDQKSVLTTHIVFGVLCIFLSYFGLLFQIIIYFSKKKLAVSQLEKKVMNSDLCRHDLQDTQVRALLQSFNVEIPV